MTRNRLVVLAVALLLAGCATGGKFLPPKLSLVGAGMVSPDVFSQEFRVTLHVDNPNDREVRIKSIEYKLFLEGDTFAQDSTSSPFAVPAKGQAEFDMIMHTHYTSSIGRLLSHIAGTTRREIQYNFEGTMSVEGSFGKIKFNEVGRVNLAKF